MEQQSPDSAALATQGTDVTGGETRHLAWAEASIWTDRMVSALAACRTYAHRRLMLES